MVVSADLIGTKIELMSDGHSRTNEYIFMCPFCNDNYGKLGVNLSMNVYHCFKCDSSGSVKYLLHQLGIDIDVGMPCIGYDIAVDEFINGPKLVPLDEILRDLPDSEPIDVSKDSMAIRYLHDRGVRDIDIELHGMRWGRDKYAGRIIIPTYENGLPVYFVSRSYSGKSPKYKNPAIKKNYVFNLNNIHDRKSLIITEGVFSAIAAGPNAVAIFGKTMLPQQFDKICKLKFDQVIIALDNGAEYYSSIMASMFRFINSVVRIVSFSDVEDDPDTAGHVRLQELIRASRNYRSLDYCAQGIESPKFYNAYCKYVA